MTTAQLEAKVQELFTSKMNLDVPGLDTDLVEEGILDSLALIDMLVKLEEVFGVQVGLDELEIDTFRTVKSIALFIEQRSAA